MPVAAEGLNFAKFVGNHWAGKLDSAPLIRRVNGSKNRCQGSKPPRLGTALRHASGNCKRRGCSEFKEAPRQNEGMAMLVLSRKKNESIVINNDITIVVVEIRGDKVRLGVEAPKEVPVHRREVYDAIKRNEAAQNGSAATEAGSNTASSS